MKKKQEPNQISLKPCPFCGGKAYVGIEHFSTFWTIGCTKCRCDFQRQFKSKTKAIKFWNKRYEE